MLREALEKVLSGVALTFEEAARTMDIIMRGEATAAQIAGLLIALKQKGETAQEVAGFVQTMRDHAVKVTVDDECAVDGCGTGGDGAHTFNISTAAAIVAAAAGVTVAKHGNRSVSSKCGSADLLEVCGGNIDPGPQQVEKNIVEVGFGFMFAPSFHPAMKHAMTPRKELGVRTVFNILGPMCNPALVKRQLIGVYDGTLLGLMADVLEITGSTKVIVAHSRDGLDEFSVSAPTDYIEVTPGGREAKTLRPDEVGIARCDADALAGGDATHNRDILTQVLQGRPGPYREAVILNAGVMTYIADRADSIADGVRQATRALDSGAGRQLLEDWIKVSQTA